jgi:hypothetical protein
VDGSAPAFLLGIAENGFTFVVFGTVAFSLLMSVLFLVTKGTDSLYDQIGQGGISREDSPGAGGQQLDSAAARAEQEEEIRQMLGARNERLLRRGEPALDVDAEVARLLQATPQPKNHYATRGEEVRQLVIARNERRLRQGLEELDVEGEVARTLAELDP